MIWSFFDLFGLFFLGSILLFWLHQHPWLCPFELTPVSRWDMKGSKGSILSLRINCWKHKKNDVFVFDKGQIDKLDNWNT